MKFLTTAKEMRIDLFITSATCVTALKLSVENEQDFALLKTAPTQSSYTKVTRTCLGGCNYMIYISFLAE